MKNFYFKERDGQTPLPDFLQNGLKPKHIQTTGELDEYEEANIARGIVWLEGRVHRNFLKYEFWLQLHSKLFSDVWKWAGKVRENELDNPYFNLPHQIWASIRKLENDIEFWLKEKPFSEQNITARIHERLLTIHPSANGNGRFSRILVEYICQSLNWKIPTWGFALKDHPAQRRAEYIEALNQVRETKNYDRLENFIFS